MISLFRENKRLVFFVALFLFSIYSSFLIAINAAKYNSDKHLVLLTSQFLTGHLAIPPTSELPVGDVANYYNNFYLYFGPLPSILLMPFVFIFGKNFPQITIGIASIIASFIAVYFICKTFKFNRLDSLWLSLFFSFSTVLLSSGLINITAYQVEVMAVPFILFSLLSYFKKKNPLITGAFVALAVMTRFTLAGAVVFFFVEFLQKRINLKQLILIIMPVVIAFSILGLYNNRRFHSFFETGYNYNTNKNSYPLSLNLKKGETNLSHVPAHLYTFLVMPPLPLLEEPAGFALKFPYLKASPWGMAIWFTSPLFLVLLWKFKKEKHILSAAITVISIALPLFLYYSIGFAQFGYRYSLDFLPFLFLLLIPSLLPRLSKKDLVLIAIGVIFNAVYITSLWDIYPIFGIY